MTNSQKIDALLEWANKTHTTSNKGNMEIKQCKFCGAVVIKREDESINHFLHKRKFCSPRCNIDDQKKHRTGFGEWNGRSPKNKKAVI